ncbi:hypothetical protein [Nakamurella deserti]|uniref:hypothetical protein n=1 Tax=Nakamurella deserti TaxID=2164074 RepID=UPI0013007659|nr:hypothetical protein [Nakamurella deserti]
MPRRRRSAGLTAGLTAVLVLGVPLALGTVAAAEPATQKQGARTVAVSESQLPDTDATFTVTGSGFDPAVDTYLAVCRADITATDPLTTCVGGPVPDDNDTAGWAEVTSEPEGKRNSAVYGDGGTFSVDLTLTSASDAGVDCVAEGCVLIVRSAGEEADRPQDITVGLGFAAAPSSSASSESSTTASEAPATVGPDTVALPEAYLGQQQTVVFTGFAPDEEVGVTVFSEPVNVDGVVASPAGVVAITFPVSEALVPGTHTVQAIGRQSGVIGIASFAVVAPPVTSSASVETSTSAPTTEASSAPVTTAAPTTTESSTGAAVTTGEATTTGSAAPAEPVDPGRNLWWVWVTLALLVVAAAVAVAVTASRRRAQQLEQEQLDREAELAAMADTHPPTWAGGTGAPYTSPPPRPGYEPYDPGQSYGLLSGRDGDGPALYSGQGLGGQASRDDEPPTRWIDPDDRSADLPTTAIRPERPDAGSTPAAPSTPPATERAAPDGDDPDAPRTQQWSPFGDEDEGGGEPPRRR